MSNYCTCCTTDRQWALNHLNWDIREAIGVRATNAYTDADWLREARECRALWASANEPLDSDLSDQRLAALLREINSTA